MRTSIKTVSAVAVLLVCCAPFLSAQTAIINGIPNQGLAFTASGYPQLAQAVNSAVSAGTITTLAQAFGSKTTAGNSIVCFGFSSATTVPSISDADGNTYSTVQSGTTGQGAILAIAVNILGTSTDLVTETVSSGAASFACYEIKGTVSAGQVWGANDITQGTGATITNNPLVNKIPGDMVLLAVGLGGGTVASTPGIAGNLSTITTVDAANTAPAGGAALSTFYAAHTTQKDPIWYTQSVALSGSQTYSEMIVVIEPAKIVQVTGPFAQIPYTALQSAATANGNGTAVSVAGTASGIFNVTCTVSCSGGTTITFQGTANNAQWVAIHAQQVGTNNCATTVVNQASGSVTLWAISINGLTSVRAVISAYSAGTITVGYLGSEAGYGTSNVCAANISGSTGVALDAAAGATAAANSLQAGQVYSSTAPAPTTGQQEPLQSDASGNLLVLPYGNTGNLTNGTGNATGTGSTAIIAAAGAGIRIYVVSCQVNNTSANNTFVELEDGSTIRTYIPAPATSGAVITFPAPLRGTANTALNFVAGTSSSTIYVSCQGFTGA